MPDPTAKALSDINSTLKDILKAVKPKPAHVNLEYYAFGSNEASPEILASEVPVHIDWVNPHIEGLATIRKDEKGRVTMTIQFEESGTDAAFEQSLRDVPPELFQLSSMSTR